MIARLHDRLAVCVVGCAHLMGATARPHVGLTFVGARLDCPLSRREVRAAAAAVLPVILASQS
eukprot:4291598-Prymnesium_polylepis.1